MTEAGGIVLVAEKMIYTLILTQKIMSENYKIFTVLTAEQRCVQRKEKKNE